MKEIRWHARAGQGAKTASQLFATAMMRSGKFVQAFPEYGPERRGAPIRAYTRIDERPIRRHDSITDPDVVVVLEPSLLTEGDAFAGLGPDGLLLLNADTAEDARVTCVPASRLSAERGSKFANLVMAGALAAALQEPALPVEDAAIELLGKKVAAADIRAAVREGHAWLSLDPPLCAGGAPVWTRQAAPRPSSDLPASGGRVSTRPVCSGPVPRRPGLGPDRRVPAPSWRPSRTRRGHASRSIQAELKSWGELPTAGVVHPAGASRPQTGAWRTGLMPAVDLERCVNCLLCWLYCPDDSVALDGTTFAGFDLTYCKGCELCAEICPTGAIEMVSERD